MEVLAAFDKCKDSLSAWEICSLVQKTLYSEFGIENTKIAPIHVKKSGNEPNIIKPSKEANINWVNQTG